MPCRCPPVFRGAPPEGAVSVVEHEQMPAEYQGSRAGSYVGSGSLRVDVDRRWWQTLSPAAQAAVKAHEVGHEIAGSLDCEPCADRAAGYLMRLWGYTSATTERAMRELRLSRPYAPVDALDGWKRASAVTLDPNPELLKREAEIAARLDVHPDRVFCDSQGCEYLTDDGTFRAVPRERGASWLFIGALAVALALVVGVKT